MCPANYKTDLNSKIETLGETLESCLFRFNLVFFNLVSSESQAEDTPTAEVRFGEFGGIERRIW